MKRGLLLLTIILFALPSLAYAQYIDIVFPEDGVTYGPWSDTYYFSERLNTTLHHIRLNLSIDQDNVVAYRIYRNGEPISYVGGMPMDDYFADDEVMDFRPDDTQPIDFVGNLFTLNNFTVEAFDINNNSIQNDSSVFYLSVNIEDYFEILDADEEFMSELAVSEEDLANIDVTQELYQESTDYFTITKKATYLQVRDRVTGRLENHTQITINVQPLVDTTDVTLYNLIPKYIVEHVNDLILTEAFNVLDPDPLIMWNFAELSGTKEITYHVNEHVSGEGIEEITAMAVAEGHDENVMTITSSDNNKSYLFYLIPIVIVPFILITMLYYGKHKK